jgi:hypothetical protein
MSEIKTCVENNAKKWLIDSASLFMTQRDEQAEFHSRVPAMLCKDVTQPLRLHYR